jgi:hypothetical protein
MSKDDILDSVMLSNEGVALWKKTCQDAILGCLTRGLNIVSIADETATEVSGELFISCEIHCDDEDIVVVMDLGAAHWKWIQ